MLFFHARHALEQRGDLAEPFLAGFSCKRRIHLFGFCALVVGGKPENLFQRAETERIPRIENDVFAIARLLYEDSDAGTALAVTLARKRASMMQPQTEFRPDYFMELIDHVTLGLGGAVRLITKTEAEIGVEDHDGNEDR